MLTITESNLEGHDPFAILKDKQLIDKLFSDVFLYEAKFRKEQVRSIISSSLVGEVFSLIGLPNFVASGFSFLNSTAKKYSEKELINFLILLYKKHPENFEKSVALIVILVGISSFHVASVKNTCSMMQQSLLIYYRTIVDWNAERAVRGAMAHLAGEERDILININRAILAYCMNLYFSDAKISANSIKEVISRYLFDTDDDDEKIIPVCMKKLLNFKFRQGIGIISLNTVGMVYEKNGILNEFIARNYYSGKQCDTFIELIDTFKDKIVSGEL